MRDADADDFSRAHGTKGVNHVVFAVRAPRDRVKLARKLCTAQGRQLSIVREPAHGIGMQDELFADVSRTRKDARKTLGGCAGVAQHPKEPVRFAEGIRKSPEGQQAEVGIDTVREPFEEGGQQLFLNRGCAAEPLGERIDVVKCALGISVADRFEASALLFGTQRNLAIAQARRCHEERAVVDLLV